MALRNLFARKRPPDAELDSELGFHIESLIREKIEAGKTEEQARREAALEFGGREQVKEDLRAVHRLVALDNTVANLRSGLRLIAKAPGFSLAVILTLGLGIGANSAVFSAIDAILLRPLPFPDSNELVLLHQLDHRAENPNQFIAPVRLLDWSRRNGTFQAISGWYTEDVSEKSGALPEKVTEALVAPQFLRVWGVWPAIGRDFSQQEEHFGGSHSVLLSDRYWRRRYNADPSALGKQLRIEGWSFTIIGVMPASFLFPDRDVDLWVPNPMDAPYGQDRNSTWFTAIGRLKPRVTIAQARADMAQVQTQLGRQFPQSDAKLSVLIDPLKETIVGGIRRSLWVLFGSVSLLLLIACTNIAALLLARATERQREIAVRFSLGASRLAVIVQMLTECLILVLIGCTLGVTVAALGVHTLHNLAKTIPRAEEVALDWRIVLYTLVCAVLATLLCGCIPAILGTRRSVATRLAHASRTQVSTRNSLQWLLVGIQVSCAVTLLIGAGLLLRSFQALARVSPGFETAHILTLRISGNWGETTNFKQLSARIDRTLDELRTMPGVRGAATTAMMPGTTGELTTAVRIVEKVSDQSRKIVGDSRWVSNGYFDTIRIPILAGEPCAAGQLETALVNHSFANAYFSAGSAIGNHLDLATNPYHNPAARIIGIAGDARENGLDRESVPTIYWCISAPDPFPVYLIRTQSNPMAMAAAIRRKIHQIEPSRSVYEVSGLEEHLSDSFAETRLRTILLTLFAMTAMSLACIGLYGTMSYFVTVRRREVALRFALGALRGQIILRFLSRGLLVAGCGCLVGLCLASGLTHVLAGMLYGVSALDPETFGGVSVLILSVAAVATLIPSIRAARLEAISVLRDE